MSQVRTKALLCVRFDPTGATLTNSLRGRAGHSQIGVFAVNRSKLLKHFDLYYRVSYAQKEKDRLSHCVVLTFSVSLLVAARVQAREVNHDVIVRDSVKVDT